MPEYCTCGTKLVEDARFCHRCGRPTFEEVREAIDEPVSAPPPPVPTAAEKLAQLPVTFANPIALRIAFLLAMAIVLILNIPILQLLFFGWWAAAGWVAVLWYRRMTGSQLSVSAGARLGSITGVMIFAAILVELALQFLLAGKQIFDQLSAQDSRIAEMMKDPGMMSAVSVITMGFLFALIVGICAGGGALGALFSSRELRRTL